MAAVALDVVRATSGFPRWWNAMAVKLEKLRACLLDLSSHPSCVANNKAVCHEVLQLVADTLTEVTDLAGRCTEDSWEKVNPSTMGAVAVKVDVSLSDCKLLVKIGKLYDDTSSLPPLDDTSTCVDIRELQRLSAWLEMSHMEAKIHALDGLLEAMRKDEKSVVSMLDHCDNVSDMVQLLSVSWPEVIREKATMVVCHVAPGSNGWLLESEVGLRLLVRQAKSGNVMDCQKAAVVLHHLSSTSCSTARVIVSHFGICPLIEMCRRIHNGGGDSVSQSSAAGMLKNVFMAMDFRRSVDNHRSVRVMVDLLLESADDAVPDESKEHAVECLKDFTSRENDDELRRAVVSEGGLRALLLYYLGDNDHRHEAAVSAIRNLVGVISSSRWWWASDTTTTMKRLAGEQGCVPLLVRTMVKHESKDAREVAVQMLACLATYPPNAMEMDADDKCVPALLHLLDLSPNTNAANKHANQCLRPNATVTLHHLSSTSRSTACSIVSHGGVGPLIKMCRQKGIDSVCQSAAAGILKNISAVPELQQSLEDHGIVHVIGQLLDPRHAHNAANKQAIQYLLSLASSKRCRNLMISHGAIEHLRKLSDMDVEGATELLHRLEGGWLKGLFSSSKQ
ncbi:hypothetical protein QOZ80_9BG0714430 [Eleusine coracana subsp. coracana]|nr:hypothetical protein QOZ80_9BG0714430 [Eleusine coracana subsp. coracana]